MAANIRAVYKESSVPAPTLKFDLIVKNGTGSGTYEENEVVSIQADAAPAGEEFDRWMITSGTAIFDNYKSPNTTITIKDSNVKIEALYKKLVPVHTHTYGAWSYDGLGHWQECTDSACPNKAMTIRYLNYHQFTNGLDTTCNVCGYVRTLPTYKMMDGMDGQWVKGSGKDLYFKANGDFNDFMSLKIDDKFVSPSNYQLFKGSTIVTLNKDYLETLAVGKHTITFMYKHGGCSADFEIVNADAQKPVTPEEDKKPSTETKKPTSSRVDKKADVKSEKKKSLNTAYSYNMGQWMALLLMSGVVLVLTVFKKKRN